MLKFKSSNSETAELQRLLIQFHWWSTYPHMIKIS